MDQQTEDLMDMQFIQNVVAEVTQSCALPFAVPAERIPNLIMQAARYWWENCDGAVKQRIYCIPYTFIQQCNANKIVNLPVPIQNVFSCLKSSSGYYSKLGDFSIERMMLNSFAYNYGGVGTGTNTSMTGQFNLKDVVYNMYEVDTFEQTLTSTLSFNYNSYAHELVILGDLGHNDIIIQCWQRCTLQELYDSGYFFRYVVDLVKKSLATIYGSFEFKLPGGVTINYDNFKSEADEELSEIKDWIKSNNSTANIFQPNVV